MKTTDGNSSRKQPTPRQEATPKQLGELTEAQRCALERAWGLTRFYLEPESPEYSRYRAHERSEIGRVLPPIDTQRRSMVLLVDGARGTGKTALLVSLVHAWNGYARPKQQSSSLEPFCDTGGRIVPIGLLDLRSLPQDTSLLFHVSTVLGRLVEFLIGNDFGPSEGSSNYISPISPHPQAAGEELRKAWRTYQQAIASMELHIRGRSRDLDPESFADELRITGRERVDIRRMFGDLMDQVVETFAARRQRERGRSEGPPLFVLAIDDADMSPHRVGECFELIERLEHPRLLLLYSGDSKIFNDVLVTQFIGELSRPLPSQLSGEGVLQVADIQANAQMLARRYYDKMIPESHRCKINSLEVGERIESLQDSLKSVLVGNTNLGAIVRRTPIVAQALPETIRMLIDFESTLRTFAGHNDGALGVLDRLRQLAMSRSQPGQAMLLEGLVRKEPQLFPSVSVPRPVVDASMTRLDFSSRVSIDIETDAGIIIRLEKSRLLTTFGPSADHSDINLGATTTALIILANYIGWHLSGEHVEFAPSRVESAQRKLVSTILPARHDVEVTWPSLQLSAPQFMEFYRRWNPFLKSKLPKVQIEQLALAYLSMAFASRSSATDEIDTSVSGLDMRDDVTLAQAWHTLAGQCESEDDIESILRFALPELGVPSAGAARVIDAVHGSLPEDRWASLLASVNSRRGESMEASSTSSVDEWLEELRRDFDEHSWYETLRTDYAAGKDNVLLAALTRLKLNEPEPLPTWWPTSAADYLTPDLLQALAAAPADQVEMVAGELEKNLAEGRLPEEALYRAWKSVASSGRRNLSWSSFNISAQSDVKIKSGESRFVAPRPTSHGGLEFVMQSGDLPREINDNVERVMYWVGHDIAADSELLANQPRSMDWPLLSLYWRKLKRSGSPWPRIGWSARTDTWLQNKAWTQIDANEVDGLGELARRFTHDSISIFRGRQVSSFEGQTWFELIDVALSAFAQNDNARADNARARNWAFQIWVRDLHWFAHPSAGLESEEAAALLAAYIELVPAEMREDVTLRAISPDYELGEHPAELTTRFNWEEAQEVRAKWASKNSSLFALPPGRVQLVDRLLKVLANIETPNSSTSLANYVTSTVRSWLERSPSFLLKRITDELRTASSAEDGLHRAWRSVVGSSGATNESIESDRFGGRLVEDGLAAVRRSEEVVSYHGGEVWKGQLKPARDGGLRGALRSIAKDLRLDLADSTFDGAVAWPLLEGDTEPLISVNWRTQADIENMVESWNRWIVGESSTGKITLSRALRAFLQITTHVYQARSVCDEVARTAYWKTVFAKTYSAWRHPESARDESYGQWLDQLEAFANSVVDRLPKDERSRFTEALALAYSEYETRKQANKDA